MLNVALGLFVLAALFGLYMARGIFRGVLAPRPASIAHALLAAAGLVALIYALATGARTTQLLVGGSLLVLAALGGLLLGSFHIRKAVAPRALVFVHALAAVGGVATLLAAVVGLI